MWEIWKQFHNSYFGYVAFPLIIHYKTFKKTYNFLQKSQRWSQDELREYQLRQLSQLLKHSYRNVPYYKKKFEKQGLKPNNIKDFEDFKMIPFLTKEIVRGNLNDLRAVNYPKNKFEYLTTGGTTGTPSGFYVEKDIFFAEEVAYYKISMDRVHCDFKDKFVYLRDFVIPSAKKAKFWKYALFGRCLILSSYHMSEENLPKYIEKIRSFKPKFINAYPSSIFIIARFMKKNNIEPFKTVKAIICGGENLYDWQWSLLEDIFKCRPLVLYGLAERVASAVICMKNKYYHFFPQYGIVELISKDGRLVTREGEKGEIVGTGFHNYIFPFIRYKTGDVGIYCSHKCECGRNYPLIKIEGRIQQFLVSKTKRLIPLLGFIGLVAKSSQNVKQFQYYQDTEGEIVLYVVKGKQNSEFDEKLIKHNFHKIIGNEINLTIQYVDHIPRTTEGKYRFLIQKLPVELAV